VFENKHPSVHWWFEWTGSEFYVVNIMCILLLVQYPYYMSIHSCFDLDLCKNKGQETKYSSSNLHYHNKGNTTIVNLPSVPVLHLNHVSITHNGCLHLSTSIVQAEDIVESTCGLSGAFIINGKTKTSHVITRAIWNELKDLTELQWVRAVVHLQSRKNKIKSRESNLVEITY
jgi:hypothetical protein